MKKILALLLAVAIVMTMSIPAFAAEADETVTDHSGSATATDVNNAQIGVYGNYLTELEADKVLSVDVSWTDMYFKYAASKQGTWDPESHTYTGGTTTGSWLNDEATITLANHSNTAVTAELSFEKTAANVTGTLSEDSVELATAVDTDKDAPPSEDVTFTVSGSMSEGETDLGTISVSLKVEKADTDTGNDGDDGDDADNGSNDDGNTDSGENEGDNSVTGLNLSTYEVDDWQEKIEAYLAKIDPDKNGDVSLVTTLGVSTVTSAHAQAISSALGSYYSDGSGAEVALTITDATEISKQAFKSKCYHCNAISLPNVTKLGEEAFMSCGKVTSFNLPKCTNLGSKALSYCSSLTEVVFGATITYTDGYFFGQTSDGTGDIYGTTTNTENITVTIGADQGNYDSGTSIVYVTQVGAPGKFISNTFKEVKRAS